LRRIAVALTLSVAALCGCDKEIQHGLTEYEANEIMVTLANEKIPAEKVVDAHGDAKKGGAFVITVEEGLATRAMQVLLEKRLPRPHELTLREQFSSQSMIPTSQEEHARFLVAREGDIASMIEKADRVVDATVHLVMPEVNPLDPGQDSVKARAAVFVKYQPRGDVKEGTEQIEAEHKKYKNLLTGLADSLDKLKTNLKRLEETTEKERAAMDTIGSFVKEKRFEAKTDESAQDARKTFTTLQGYHRSRDETLKQINNLDKIKNLQEIYNEAIALEAQSLPFKSANVRSLVAGSVPRLETDDVFVEFTEVVPRDTTPIELDKHRAAWETHEVFLGLAGGVALLACGVVGLAIWTMSLRKSVAAARAQAAKAASSKLGGSMIGGGSMMQPPPNPPGGGG
jgi:type III secretion system YscJ/HrcJ family lipoprotein